MLTSLSISGEIGITIPGTTRLDSFNDKVCINMLTPIRNGTTWRGRDPNKSTEIQSLREMGVTEIKVIRGDLWF